MKNKKKKELYEGGYMLECHHKNHSEHYFLPNTTPKEILLRICNEEKSLSHITEYNQAVSGVIEFLYNRRQKCTKEEAIDFLCKKRGVNPEGFSLLDKMVFLQKKALDENQCITTSIENCVSFEKTLLAQITTLSSEINTFSRENFLLRSRVELLEKKKPSKLPLLTLIFLVILTCVSLNSSKYSKVETDSSVVETIQLPDGRVIIIKDGGEPKWTKK